MGHSWDASREPAAESGILGGVCRAVGGQICIVGKCLCVVPVGVEGGLPQSSHSGKT
jgi:hypothetical protein